MIKCGVRKTIVVPNPTLLSARRVGKDGDTIGELISDVVSRLDGKFEEEEEEEEEEDVPTIGTKKDPLHRAFDS